MWHVDWYLKMLDFPKKRDKASIHRYVNNFDIQVLMMVTETEALTSTSHRNIFTYLDYVFSATFILDIYNLVKFVLWHINYGWLFNAKSCLYIYIEIYDSVCFGSMEYQQLLVI